MSVFALLDYEGEVQKNDKVRLDASKSFAAKDSLALTSITVTPEISGSAISVGDAYPSDVYLDWVYETTSIDVDSTNNDLSFSEAGTEINTTLTAGTYTIAQYGTHIAARMTLAGTQTYTSSTTSDVITITAAARFGFLECTVSTQGFFEIGTLATSQVSDRVEYGTKKVTIDVTNGTDTDSKSFYIKVYSEEGDHLFSSDRDLMAHEPDIMKWVPDGRSSYLNVHRKAQKLMLQWIDRQGFVNVYGTKFTKNDLIDVQEMNEWSTFMSLRLIFFGMSNAIDDIFDRKSKEYSILEEEARQRALLRIDTNKDGIADTTEGFSMSSGRLFRR